MIKIIFQNIFQPKKIGQKDKTKTKRQRKRKQNYFFYIVKRKVVKNKIINQKNDARARKQKTKIIFKSPVHKIIENSIVKKDKKYNKIETIFYGKKYGKNTRKITKK